MTANSVARPSGRPGRLRAVGDEIGFAWWSRYFVWVLLAGVVAGVLSVVTLNGMAVSASQDFQRTLSEERESGVDVDAELRAPLHVEPDGDQTVIDNPVRYDYERARAAAGMLRPWGYSANAAQVAGFLLAPLVGFGAGLALSLKDFRHRTIRLRAVRFRLGSLETAYSLTAGLLGVAAVVGATVAAVVAGAATSGSTLSGLALDRSSPFPDPVGVPGAAAWVGFAVVASFYFGAIGVSIGLVTRALVAPMAVFTAMHLMVPILGPWDPRAMILSIGNALIPLSGTLRLNPISGTLPPVWNLALLVAEAAVLLVLGRIALSARPRWGAG